MRRLTLYKLVPNAEAALSMTPEQLAVPLLQVLSDPENEALVNSTNIKLAGVVEGYPSQLQGALQAAVWQAWRWLESSNFVGPDFSKYTGNWYVVTEAGRRFVATATAAAR